MVTHMNLLASKQRPERGLDRKRISGFTLVEVLTVITLVAVLMALGVPSYQYVTSANRISGEVNGMLGDLQYARSEAIKEGQTVTVCSSANPTAPAPTCAGGTTGWQSGWIVFTDVNGTGAVDSPLDTILRVQRAFSLGDTFNADNNMKFVTFNREGFALGLNNTVTVTLHAAVPDNGSTRCLQITIVGQLKTETAGVGACT
jgi:type IV fimbrial biogenesis protein FimT